MIYPEIEQFVKTATKTREEVRRLSFEIKRKLCYDKGRRTK